MKKLIRMKILIVDDDPGIQKLIKNMLAKDGYKNIQTVDSGEGALEMMKKTPPDLVVLDIQLPGMKGYEVSQKMRTNKSTAHIPILMMTGKTSDADKALEKSFRAGVTDFITKPIKMIEFKARVKAALTIKRNFNFMQKELNKRKLSKKVTKKMVWLNILPDDVWIKVRRGDTVYNALQNTEIELEKDCAGLGKCGKCKIRVITPLGKPSEETLELLDPDELERGIRLACQTKILRNLAIYTKELDDETEFFQILKHGHMPEVELDPLIERRQVSIPPPSLENSLSDVQRIREALGPEYQNLKTTYRCLFSLYKNLRATDFEGTAIIHNNCLVEWQPRDSIGGVFGLTFDLGTSTLVGKLVNLLEGQEVAVISRFNSQRKYGADVISRIQYIKGHPKGLVHLQKILIRDLNLITKRLLESFRLKQKDILVSVAAGNTTMQHFMLSLDPTGIAEAPFTPLITEGMTFRARDVGLRLHPDAMLYVMPAKSGYIGGDLIGFILSSGAAEQDDKLVLGLDLGTNSEIFLGNKRRMLTCSAAAGPALEGARISHGMIARAGAIESFRFEENDIFYNVIGNIKPKGLCGSGLVDLAALLLHHGIVDPEGLICPPDQHKKRNSMTARVIQTQENEIHDFLLASPRDSLDGKPIVLTQKDIRELQLAKAAIASGIKILLKTMGAGIEDIDDVYLAGALGNYVHPLSAMRIGLLPKVNPEKIISLGNAASTGANMILLSKRYWKRSAEIAADLEHLELSGHTDF
ncbi:ASKHA domain-containing protein, partial [Thermodesulfobacteriota bacterium]